MLVGGGLTLVCIPAYAEPAIEDTVRMIRDYADGPVRFAIVLHTDDDELCKRLSSAPDTELYTEPASCAQGVAAARSVLWQMACNTDGVQWGFSIDAHTTVRRGWDTQLIDQQQRATNVSGRPAILSAPCVDTFKHNVDAIFLPQRIGCRCPLLRGMYLPAGVTGLNTFIPSRKLSMQFAFFPYSLFKATSAWPSWLGYVSEEPWFTVACFAAGYSLYHPYGDIAKSAMPPVDKLQGSGKQMADAEDKSIAEGTHPSKVRGAMEYFSSRSVQSYFRYALEGHYEPPQLCDWGPTKNLVAGSALQMKTAIDFNYRLPHRTATLMSYFSRWRQQSQRPPVISS